MAPPPRAELVQNRHASPAGWHAAANDPRLATLKRLGRGLGNVAHYSAFMLSPMMRALESVELAKPEALEQLLARRPLALTRVMLAFQPSREQLRKMAASRSFAALETLAPSVKPQHIDALFDDLRATGWLRRVSALHVYASISLHDPASEIADEIFAHWKSLPKSLRQLAVIPNWGEVRERNRR